MRGLHYVGNRVGTKLFASLFIILGLVACSRADKPTDPDTRPTPEYAFSFNANGEFVAKDGKGLPMGDTCSADPKAANVCPFFRAGHKIQLEQASNIFIARYSGSPQCIAVIVNGKWYVLPSMAYCSQ